MLSNKEVLGFKFYGINNENLGEFGLTWDHLHKTEVLIGEDEAFLGLRAKTTASEHCLSFDGDYDIPANECLYTNV